MFVSVKHYTVSVTQTVHQERYELILLRFLNRDNASVRDRKSKSWNVFVQNCKSYLKIANLATFLHCVRYTQCNTTSFRVNHVKLIKTCTGTKTELREINDQVGTLKWIATLFSSHSLRCSVNVLILQSVICKYISCKMGHEFKDRF